MLANSLTAVGEAFYPTIPKNKSLRDPFSGPPILLRCLLSGLLLHSTFRTSSAPDGAFADHNGHRLGHPQCSSSSEDRSAAETSPPVAGPPDTATGRPLGAKPPGWCWNRRAKEMSTHGTRVAVENQHLFVAGPAEQHHIWAWFKLSFASPMAPPAK